MTASTLRSLPVTDLTSAAMLADPFPHWARMRAQAPVSLARSAQGGGSRPFLLARHEDVSAMNNDRRLSTNLRLGRGAQASQALPRAYRLLMDGMLFTDGKTHRRLRALAGKAMTPRLTLALQQGVDDTVTRLLEGIEERARRGPVDLVAALAEPLPMTTVTDLLGVDPADAPTWHRTMHRLAGVESLWRLPRLLREGKRLVSLEEGLIAHRRTEPDDRLVTALLRAGDRQDRLSAGEVLAMTHLFLMVGHDTTTSLIGSGVLALLDHPEELARLRADPALIDSAVEELLRFTAPVPAGPIRTALADVEFSGVTVPKGSAVMGMLVSANRDEEVFTDPDRLDLGRTGNRHLAFADGPHACIGGRLARMQTRAALLGLLERFDRIELAVPRNRVRYQKSATLRGLRELPVRLG